MPDAGSSVPVAEGDFTHPAVVAIVDHFVSEGFDPGMEDYCDTALVALAGLAKAGFTLVRFPREADCYDPPGDLFDYSGEEADRG